MLYNFQALKESNIKDTERGTVARIAGEINEYIHQGVWPDFGAAIVQTNSDTSFFSIRLLIRDPRDHGAKFRR